jgi:hypothetical protein
MNDEAPHLSRPFVLSALAKGRIRAQQLLGTQNRSLEEYGDILVFIRNSVIKEDEMRKNNELDDVNMSELLPPGVGTSMSQKLKEGAGVETVQDLLLCKLSLVRSVLAGEPVFLLEAILAMHPNPVGEEYLRTVELLDNWPEN